MQNIKGEVIVNYYEPLITQQMEACGSPFGRKLMNKKDHYPICPLVSRSGRRVYPLGKTYNCMILYKPGLKK
jgi:hypothetical protein